MNSIWAGTEIVGTVNPPIRPGGASSIPAGSGVPAQDPAPTVGRPASSRPRYATLTSTSAANRSSC
ncbi:hypothetical protein [Micromonospora lupini]|uniref:hypothetical protein n=1 Tax=Micromonospora lupini TaxID=285679 RepID=UPI0033CB6CF0